MDATEVDILIVGGGPAGLLAATYLSKKYCVALIERGVLGQTKKYWLTTDKRLRKHGLDHCVLRRASSMFAGSFLGSKTFAEGDFSVVDDQRFLHVLVDRCHQNQVRTHQHCELVNIAWTSRRIKAHTTCGLFLARLVVDATGGMSPIVKTFRLHRIDGFYSVYGARLDNIRLLTSDIVLGYVDQLGDPPPILEIYPTGPDSAYCSVFVYSKVLIPPSSLAHSFEHHCMRNPFFQMTSDTKRTSEKVGAIPIGQARYRRLKGVVSIGEAGCVQPPLMGTAFNEVLEHTSSVCAKISLMLDSSANIPPWRGSLYSPIKRAQDRFQLSIARILIKGNVEVFDGLIRSFERFPPSLIFKLFCNDLTWPQLAYVIGRIPWLRLARYRMVGC